MVHLYILVYTTLYTLVYTTLYTLVYTTLYTPPGIHLPGYTSWYTPLLPGYQCCTSPSAVRVEEVLGSVEEVYPGWEAPSLLLLSFLLGRVYLCAQDASALPVKNG